MNQKNQPTEEVGIEDLKAFFMGEEELLRFAEEDLSFLNGVKRATEKIKPDAKGEKIAPISDIVYEKDGQKLYFVDLVQEGGGVLGIALVGYVYVLEKAGIRFLSLGGTSAGAINTLLMAALGKPEEKKAHRLLEILDKQNFSDFQDGSPWVIRSYKALKYLFTKKPESKTPAPWLPILLGLLLAEGLLLAFLNVSFLPILVALFVSLLLFFILPLSPILFSIWTKLGLHPGRYFEKKWLDGILEKEGLTSTQDLLDHMRKLPPEVQAQLDAIPQAEVDKPRSKLPIAVIASDLTNKMKVVFPEDGPFYVADSARSSNGRESSDLRDDPSPHLLVSPASYVRASMAVPIFFFPKFYNRLPINNDDDKVRWIFRLKPNIEAIQNEVLAMEAPEKKKWIARQEINIPQESKMVDGGVISNFPIDVFHNSARTPSRPTLGIKLGLSYPREDTPGKKKGAPSKSNPIELLATSFETARLARDSDFIMSNPDFRMLVKEIPIGGFDWLNFELGQDEKRQLFLRGAQAASEFLLTFDWQEYKVFREEKLNKLVENAIGPEFFKLLQKAMKDRGKQMGYQEQQSRSLYSRKAPAISQTAKNRLRERILRLQSRKLSYNLLWVSDSVGDDENEMKMLLMVKGEGHFDLVQSSEEAFRYLQSKEYDLMVSDIYRDGIKSEGVDFLKRMEENYPQISLPPTIFYISNYDPSRGCPPYAFGITNNPAEFMHLVIDSLERKIPPQ